MNTNDYKRLAVILKGTAEALYSQLLVFQSVDLYNLFGKTSKIIGEVNFIYQKITGLRVLFTYIRRSVITCSNYHEVNGRGDV